MQVEQHPITQPPHPESVDVLTPAGVQGVDELRTRRLLVAALNVATLLMMLAVAGMILASGGWTLIDVIYLLAFAIGLPWTVLGFWNAVIGLLLLHGRRDPITAVAPFAAAADTEAPITARTAVLMTLRNEDPNRALSRLRIVRDSLAAHDGEQHFFYFVLSDTDDPAVARAEQAAMAAWTSELPSEAAARVIYRRRDTNAGYKAGNVRDFCDRWGGEFAFMVPLDADSLMSGAAILRLVRMMQAYPRLGIIQSLVVGLPSSSAFARIFQFGMRHGMRSYTIGQAWWVGDCGPYWGHNAIVRIQPFVAHCELPTLAGKPPLGGPVLSHDQVEATFMRRAGYEVRVLALEDGSWEENPPTILEFLQRDVRWCQGNLQYLKLLGTEGLHAMSRFQLAWAILMFLGIPAWTLMIALLPLATLEAQSNADFPATLAIALYIGFLAMYLMPKTAGLADTVLTRGGVARYGGPRRFVSSAMVELLFSFLQGAVSTVRTTIFMIGLAFGTRVVWAGQTRDSYGLSWKAAAIELWPQTLFGVAVCGSLLAIDATVFWWALPLTAGYLLAVPFAVVTANPAIGQWMRRTGLAGIPEDFAAPAEVRRALASPVHKDH